MAIVQSYECSRCGEFYQFKAHIPLGKVAERELVLWEADVAGHRAGCIGGSIWGGAYGG